MSGKRIIAIIGATGQQGGGVAASLLENPHFTVRAITRNKTSEKAKLLQSKGAELVEANVNDANSLKSAFAGAYGVFAITNAYDKETIALGSEGEFIQGKTMVDAAVANNVTHFVFSSLDNVEQVSNGKWNVPHWTHKNRVEEYAKTKGFKYTTFPYTSFFLTNLDAPHYKFVKEVNDGKDIYVYHAKMKLDTKIPMTDVEQDLGPVVAAAFANPEKYGKATRVNVAREFLTESEFFARVSKLTGTPVSVVYKGMPENLKQDYFIQMYGYIQEFGYFKKGEDSLALIREMNPKLKTVDDFIKEHKYDPKEHV